MLTIFDHDNNDDDNDDDDDDDDDDVHDDDYNDDGTVHNKVISGFQALRQPRAPVAGLEPAKNDPCRYQGGLASHCATDAGEN
ncbi:hypothetical protein PoB_005242700 [Plakobranchus ocellatus]|uniref:Uncharacterized protein n=1 Tax=Plakobranchus ocellatus TaxID=259542 RepID=A0AAV4C3V3_9GAST|nr:hypothetical protein PoB_005242700 [Plakobranchus ocellatus]